MSERSRPLDHRKVTSDLAAAPGSRIPLLAGVALLAFMVRLLPIVLGGGLESYGRYDDGVYYAASDALTFGRVPYRDFVLLHPPGILLVLAPFALLGRLTSDPVGMALGRLAFMAVGALNTVLVTALAWRWGRRAALAAGVLYACWFPAVYSEQSTLLEPLGGTALLVALLLLLKTARSPSRRAEVLAGVALGLAVALKIWYVAPWVAVVMWQLTARRWRAGLRLVLCGSVALMVVLLPFILLAGGRMFDMVVRDQLLRPQAATTSRLGRLSSILGVQTLLLGHHDARVTVTVIVLVSLVVAAVVCSIEDTSRPLVAVLAINLAVLLASPSYFEHYAALTAAPSAVVVGVALGKLGTAGKRRLVPRLVFAVAMVAFAASGARVALRHQDTSFPGAQLAKAAPAGCVTSDLPEALIQMNRLSSDLRSGCRVAIDVTGITYDSLHRTEPDGAATPRADNLAWQQYLYNYLLSGQSFVIARRTGDAIDPGTSEELRKQRILTETDGYVLRAGNGAS
jgi:alpha-1,2-mannosyltransferase